MNEMSFYTFLLFGLVFTFGIYFLVLGVTRMTIEEMKKDSKKAKEKHKAIYVRVAITNNLFRLLISVFREFSKISFCLLSLIEF